MRRPTKSLLGRAGRIVTFGSPRFGSPSRRWIPLFRLFHLAATRFGLADGAISSSTARTARSRAARRARTSLAARRARTSGGPRALDRTAPSHYPRTGLFRGLSPFPGVGKGSNPERVQRDDLETPLLTVCESTMAADGSVLRPSFTLIWARSRSASRCGRPPRTVHVVRIDHRCDIYHS
jgi:hypothetical protein